MSLNDVVLDIVVEKGPLLPAEIVSEVSKRTGKQTDMFFIGAILSELMVAKHVFMTHAKIGGSRLYYAKNQENNLSRLYDHLNDKEKKAYDLLKEKKVLRGNSQEPVIRVALSELKDFAKSVEVNFEGIEKFWYWHSHPIEDVKLRVKEILGVNQLKKPSQEESKSKTENNAPPIRNNESNNNFSNQPDNKKNSDQFIVRNDVDSSKKSEKHSFEDRDSFIGSTQNKEKETNSKNDLEKSTQKKESQSSLELPFFENDDPFMKTVLKYFEKNDIKCLSGSVLKKNSESEFKINIKTQIGKIKYYVYAKSKKKISETDLGYAYIKSQNSKLPLCFISTGELTKRASTMLEEELNNVIFLKM